MYFSPKKKKTKLYLNIKKSTYYYFKLFFFFFFFLFDKYNYFQPMSMVKQLLLLLFFNDLEPHQGRALWTHPWEVNDRYTTHPQEPCRLHLGLVIKISLFYYLAYLCYNSWVSLYFLVLFMSSTLLFQLVFNFIYSTLVKSF